jgi:ATP-dependent DNA helicase RecG
MSFSHNTEFTLASSDMPGSFWESYSAMANSQGGTIVLGVAEKPIGLVWEGVPDAVQPRTVLWGQLNDCHKVGSNLLLDDHVRMVEGVGRQVVVRMCRVPHGCSARRRRHNPNE